MPFLRPFHEPTIRYKMFSSLRVVLLNLRVLVPLFNAGRSDPAHIYVPPHATLCYAVLSVGSCMSPPKRTLDADSTTMVFPLLFYMPPRLPRSVCRLDADSTTMVFPLLFHMPPCLSCSVRSLNTDRCDAVCSTLTLILTLASATDAVAQRPTLVDNHSLASQSALYSSTDLAVFNGCQ